MREYGAPSRSGEELPDVVSVAGKKTTGGYILQCIIPGERVPLQSLSLAVDSAAQFPSPPPFPALESVTSNEAVYPAETRAFAHPSMCPCLYCVGRRESHESRKHGLQHFPWQPFQAMLIAACVPILGRHQYHNDVGHPGKARQVP